MHNDLCSITGNDSSVCVSDGQDCCTPAYLNNVVRSDVQNLLETYLMKEFKDGINDSISKFVQFQECKYYTAFRALVTLVLT